MRAIITNAVRSDERLAGKVWNAKFGLRSKDSRPACSLRTPRSELRASIAPNPRRCWKFQRELRAYPHITMNADSAAVGFDDPASSRQAQAAAATFGGVKGVEHFHRGSLVHADARVDQVEGDALTRDPRAGG